MKARWDRKPCGCVKTRLLSSGEKVIVRCAKHRDKTFKNRVHLHFDADGIVRRD